MKIGAPGLGANSQQAGFDNSINTRAGAPADQDVDLGADQAVQPEYMDPTQVGSFAKTKEERQRFIVSMLRRAGFGNPKNYEYVDDWDRITPGAYMTAFPSGRVEVYPAAFEALDYYSFGSVLFHEHLHLVRYAYYRALQFSVSPRTQSHYMMEAEAYGRMMTDENPFYSGTNKMFRSFMRDNDHYYGRGALIDKNKSRVDSGDYDCWRKKC